MGVVTSAALVLLLLRGGAVALVAAGVVVVVAVVVVVVATVVDRVEVTAVGVEVLMVVGAMVEGGGRAKGGGVGLSTEATEDSVNSTTREELEKRKRVKGNIKQDITSSTLTETTVTP